jgi:Flp pilus assembly protein TadD
MKGNKLDQAEDQFLKLAELAPYHYQPYYNLGLISRYKGDNEKAKYFLQMALKYAPKYANAYNSLGDVYMQTKEYLPAARAFSTALGLQPNNALFRDNFYRATEKAGGK